MAQRPTITNFAEFEIILRRAKHRTDQLAGLDPSYKLPAMIQPQLDFIGQFLRERVPPTATERERVTLGVLAVRNFEDTDPEYAKWLKALNYAFNHWEQVGKV